MDKMPELEYCRRIFIASLKNINVWSDGGVIVNDINLNKKLRLLRNHGMEDRDTITTMGYNSRLDTIQTVVGNWILPKLNPYPINEFLTQITLIMV